MVQKFTKMKNEYIIINKSVLEKRIKELEEEEISEFSPGRRLWVDSAIKNLKEVLSQSTPLIPEIEKAFDEGQNRMQHEIIEKLGLRYQIEQVSQSTILNMEVHSEDYSSNLKLDI